MADRRSFSSGGLAGSGRGGMADFLSYSNVAKNESTGTQGGYPFTSVRLKLKYTVVPFPGADFIQMEPPCR
jgi:hypothetical protein